MFIRQVREQVDRLRPPRDRPARPLQARGRVARAAPRADRPGRARARRSRRSSRRRSRPTSRTSSCASRGEPRRGRLRPGARGADPAYPHRQRPEPHAGRAPTSSSPLARADGRRAPLRDRLRRRASSAPPCHAIFEPFYTSDDAQGSGLGLAIAHELAERMDGELRRRRACPAARRSRWSSPREPPRCPRPPRPLVALLVAGCGGGERRRRRVTRARRPRRASRSLEDARRRPPRRRSFDPAAIYQRESPGVVTIISTGLGDSSGGGQRAAGLGSGFVHLRQRRDRHERPRRHERRGRVDPQGATRSTCASRTATRSPAKIVGFDPFADVALLKVDPAGLTLRPLPLGDRARPGGRRARSRRSAARSARTQSLSVGVDLGARPLDRVAHRLRHDRARSRPTRRSTTATRAARCSTPRGRVLGINAQIQIDERRGQRRRLRGVGRHGQALARPAARATASVDYAYLGVSTVAALPAARAALRARRPTHGAWVQDVVAGRAGRRRGAARRATHARALPGAARTASGGDVIVAVGGHAGPRGGRPRRGAGALRARPDGRAGGRCATASARRCASSSASGRSTRARLSPPADAQYIPRACSSPSPSAPRPSPTTRTSSAATSSRRSATLAEPLKGARVVHVSATAFGGGVSEILYTLVPLMKDVGLDVEWQVIYGREEFFNATKLMHNALQGAPEDLTRRAVGHLAPLQRDERARARRRLGRRAHPRPAAGGAATRSCPRRRAGWVWRCHIDLSTPEPGDDRAAAAVHLRLPAVALPHGGTTCPRGMNGHVNIVPPAIDPLAPKNMALSPEDAAYVCEQFGIDVDRPLMAQVSRFDPWKDPLGVIDAYRLVKEEMPGGAARARRLDGLRRPRGLGLLQRDHRPRRRRPGHPHPQQLQQRRRDRGQRLPVAGRRASSRSRRARASA